MSKRDKLIYFIISIIFFILFDTYFSKIMLQCSKGFNGNSVFDLVFVQNTGAAFSILQDSRVFLIAFSLLAVLGIVIYAIKHISKTSVFTLFWAALLVAGISCNLYERITLGYVRDFFKLNFVNFPVFNISDIFINISVFAIVVIIIKNSYLKKQQ